MMVALELISCAKVNNRKLFLELKKYEVSDSLKIKTNGYYWKKEMSKHEERDCPNIKSMIFFNDFNVKVISGSLDNCIKNKELNEDSILSLEHQRIQNLLKEGSNSKIYKRHLYWGKYRTNQKKIYASLLSTVSLGITGSVFNSSKMEGEIKSDSSISFNNKKYEFKKFDFDVDYTRIPTNKKLFSSSSYPPIFLW